MPFTDNITFKQNPKILDRAKGVHYYLEDGTQVTCTIHLTMDPTYFFL